MIGGTLRSHASDRATVGAHYREIGASAGASRKFRRFTNQGKFLSNARKV
jgi:hypothetical protein